MMDFDKDERTEKAGRTCQFVGFDVWRLILCVFVDFTTRCFM